MQTAPPITLPNQSTLLNDEEARQLVAVIGHLIREYLSYIGGNAQKSIFAEVDNNTETLQNIEPAITEAAQYFKDSPDLYQDEQLIGYGTDYETAVTHPVRIEVRRVQDEPGVAQIAARGVYGVYREAVIAYIRSRPDIPAEKYYLRLSGNASFEINIAGVDKALPLKYVSGCWDAVLDDIGYCPGPYIDARQTRTLIAADGDGTTWDSPRDGLAPELNTSAACAALIEYLTGGGIYLIVSGNHLDRTVSRVGEHVPVASRRNLLISANGGANLVHFDATGRPRESAHYRETALDVAASVKAGLNLDAVYLGDDGRPAGNDREAFEALGEQRSILVANPPSTDIIPFLINRTIGGWVDGTRRTLEWVNRIARERPRQEIFTRANISELIRRAAQG